MSISALCIGHAAWDLCFVVDSYPTENTKIETGLLLESGGGPAANAAWLLARWGVSSALAALVGEDTYGERVVTELQEARVDCCLVERRRGYSTPVSAIITNHANGSRTICNRKITSAPLGLPQKLPATWNPRLLLLDGHELDASLAAMRAYPSAITVLDAGSLREGTRELAPRVDYLVCSQRFAAQITNERDVWANWRSCVRKLRTLNGKVAVITLGEHSLVFDDGHEQGTLPALPVKAVDTTAAGDVFHGAFAYALLQNMGLKAALRLANTAAGLSVQKYGGRPSVPELAAVTEAMKHG